MIRRLFKRLFREDQGQDVIEYSLLIAFIAVAVLGLYAGAGSSTAGVWSGADNTLVSANSTAGGVAGAPSGSSGTGGGHHDGDRH